MLVASLELKSKEILKEKSLNLSNQRSEPEITHQDQSHYPTQSIGNLSMERQRAKGFTNYPFYAQRFTLARL